MTVRKLKKWLLGGAVAGAAVVLAAACGRGRWHSHHALTDEQMRKKIERGVEWVLDDVDATDEQVAEVTRVLQGAVPEVTALRDERKALVSEFQVALGKQTVDPAELEALRQKALALVDRASARGTQALAEAANKLTPEQRAELVSKWQRRHGS